MRRARKPIPRPAVMLVTDTTRRTARPGEGSEWVDDIVRDAALGGVNIVQLREKHLRREALIERGLHVRDAIVDRALLFVNGDVDAAIALAADAIHLSEDGAETAAVRGRVGDGMLISRAVHSVDAAIAAEHDGADILIAGTIFPTASKPNAARLGLDGLRRLVESVTLPVIAIGGITTENASTVMQTGAAGVAVIGAVFDAPDPRAAAVRLTQAVMSA